MSKKNISSWSKINKKLNDVCSNVVYWVGPPGVDGGAFALDDEHMIWKIIYYS